MAVALKMDDLDRFGWLLQQKGLLVAELTVAYAKRNSPYLTGHNRSSITADFYVDGRLVKSWSENGNPVNQIRVAMERGTFGCRIYTQSGYGAYLELGTKRMAARPYIYPAFERAARQVMATMERMA